MHEYDRPSVHHHHHHCAIKRRMGRRGGESLSYVYLSVGNLNAKHNNILTFLQQMPSSMSISRGLFINFPITHRKFKWQPVLKQTHQLILFASNWLHATHKSMSEKMTLPKTVRYAKILNTKFDGIHKWMKMSIQKFKSLCSECWRLIAAMRVASF